MTMAITSNLKKKYEQALRYVDMFPYSEQRQKNVLSKLGDVSLAKGNYEEARKIL